MRNLLVTLLISALLGGASFAAIFLWKKKQIDEMHDHLSAFEWFCEEFQVTGEQRGRIEAVHLEYFPECEDHCIHYADSRQTLVKITGDSGLDNSPEHEEAARRMAELQKVADEKFIEFIYRVAGEMDAAQSEIYLRRMKGWLGRPVSEGE